jgi:hypothetical protein
MLKAHKLWYVMLTISKAVIILSHDRATIDGFWIDDLIYYQLWYSLWLHFTIHYYAESCHHCHWLEVASNGRCSPSSGFPTCPRPQLQNPNSNSLQQLNCSSSVTNCNRVKVKVKLWLTVSRPVSYGINHPSRAQDQIFITVRQLRVCWWEGGSVVYNCCWL